MADEPASDVGSCFGLPAFVHIAPVMILLMCILPPSSKHRHLKFALTLPRPTANQAKPHVTVPEPAVTDHRYRDLAV